MGRALRPSPTTGSRPTSTRIRIIYRVRITGGELRDEVGGSSDACAWVRRAELAALPLVELAEVGIGLAFGARLD